MDKLLQSVTDTKKSNEFKLIEKNMNLYTVTSKNFLYLRTVFFGTHNNAAAQMHPWVTRAQLTDYCHALKVPSVDKIRALEKHLDLPGGWFERDIEALSKISEDDFDLIQLLLKKPADIKAAVKTLLGV